MAAFATQNSVLASFAPKPTSTQIPQIKVAPQPASSSILVKVAPQPEPETIQLDLQEKEEKVKAPRKTKPRYKSPLKTQVRKPDMMLYSSFFKDLRYVNIQKIFVLKAEHDTLIQLCLDFPDTPIIYNAENPEDFKLFELLRNPELVEEFLEWENKQEHTLEEFKRRVSLYTQTDFNDRKIEEKLFLLRMSFRSSMNSLTPNMVKIPNLEASNGYDIELKVKKPYDHFRAFPSIFKNLSITLANSKVLFIQERDNNDYLFVYEDISGKADQTDLGSVEESLKTHIFEAKCEILAIMPSTCDLQARMGKKIKSVFDSRFGQKSNNNLKLGHYRVAITN